MGGACWPTLWISIQPLKDVERDVFFIIGLCFHSGTRFILNQALIRSCGFTSEN